MFLIRKVKEAYGWLGNMSPHSVIWQGKHYRTSEALFQSLRFEDEEIIEQIREQRSPMSAKMIAKKHRAKMVVEPMGEADLENMKLCLRLKIEQNPELEGLLQETGDDPIIEDCSKRKRGSGLFWEAGFDGKKMGRRKPAWETLDEFAERDSVVGHRSRLMKLLPAESVNRSSQPTPQRSQSWTQQRKHF